MATSTTTTLVTDHRSDEADPILIWDGGLATLLERSGEVLDADLWSAGVLLTNPDKIE